MRGSTALVDGLGGIAAFGRRGFRPSQHAEFLPYLFGKTALVDDLFTGNGALSWQKAIRAPRGNAVPRSFDAIRFAVGKVLGF